VESKKTILIVDDHPLLREGLKAMISKENEYEVVGEAGDGREALQRVQELQPDLVLTDLSLPDRNGIDLIKDIKTLAPTANVLVITVHNKISYIADALKAGALGYLVKESAAERLLDALRYVSEGRYFLDSTLAPRVVEMLKGEFPGTKKTPSDDSYGSLTQREQEVLRLVAEGLSNKDIADKLFISPKTVENHRTNIMQKLGLHSRMELVRYAARLGLIDVDLWKE
jgi:DNA-binding NarL/FixJ family response regulator